MATPYKDAVHVHHLTLVVGAVVPYTVLFIYIVSPEFEDYAILDPAFDWDSVELANPLHEIQCCRIANTHVEVIESKKHLCVG